MTLHLKMPSKVNNLSPQICVIGVGGAGGNIINSMIESDITGVEFLNVNTDSQQLKHSQAEKTLQLGPTCTQGLGAGADPEMGKRAAEEVITEIEEYLENSNMVFLTAGMGGGTGTGATPVIARVAKELGILTVGVVTKPFDMEGKRRLKQSEAGILELQKYVDNLIVIPNQNIFHSAKPETSFSDALQLTNDVLIDGVKSIIDLMVKPGIMNHDFADVKAIMSETGKVHLGTGMSEGENRSTEATEKAISNPLLEYNSMNGAKGVLINITCGEDTTLHEVDLAINMIKEESDEDANLIWGVQKDSNFANKFKISVISTGIDSENYYKKTSENFEKEKELSSEKISFSSSSKSAETNQSEFFIDTDFEKNSDFSNTHVQERNLSNAKEEIANQEKMNLNQPNNFKSSSLGSQNQPKSFLSRIFGTKVSVSNQTQKQQINEAKFETEMQEILNKKNDFLKPNNSVQNTESGSLVENEKNIIEKMQDSQNSENKSGDIELDDLRIQEKTQLDDDLLQIPAFLRRQAN